MLIKITYLGYIFDVTNNYDLSFHFVGFCILISGLMLYPIPCIQRKWGTESPRELAYGKKSFKIQENHQESKEGQNLNV